MIYEKEQDIQKSIIEYLQLKKFVVFKHNSTQFGIRNGKGFAFSYGTKGVSDLIACSPKGVFTAVEVKTRKGAATPEQLEFIARVNANGGIGIIAHSIDEVMAVI